jgi:hypothetical protein
VKRNQALLASDSWYDLDLFALGIALGEFKKCGFPIKAQPQHVATRVRVSSDIVASSKSFSFYLSHKL